MPSYTIYRDPARPTGPLDLAEGPNDQSADVTAVAFNDDGSFVDRRQLESALQSVVEARRRLNGALVVVFAHGWHHSARWDSGTGEGDQHYTGFRNVLMSLALREAERYGATGPLGRRVVGIFLGWNGDPVSGIARFLTNRLTSAATFGNRYAVAEQIGRSPALRETLR